MAAPAARPRLHRDPGRRTVSARLEKRAASRASIASRSNSVPIIAVTSGEPAGIGPDVCLALARNRFAARIVVLGDRGSWRACSRWVWGDAACARVRGVAASEAGARRARAVPGCGRAGRRCVLCGHRPPGGGAGWLGGGGIEWVRGGIDGKVKLFL